MVEQNKEAGKMTWESVGGNNNSRIGGNASIIKYEHPDGKVETLAIDCGMLFANKELTPDYEGFIPQQQYFGLQLVTHCHQDHTGGLAHLALLNAEETKRRKDAGEPLPEVRGSSNSIKWEAGLLADAKVPEEYWPTLTTIKPQDKFNYGIFEIEAIEVAHSAPGSMGFKVKTPAGTLVHCGDFKMEGGYIGKTDVDHLKAISKEGVDAVLLDSTSSSFPGKVLPEKVVEDGTVELFEQHPDQRFVVGLIGRSMERFATLCAASARVGRNVVLIEGTALKNGWNRLAPESKERINAEVRKHCGKDLVVKEQKFAKPGQYKDNEVMVLGTGPFGDKNACLWLASVGEHSRLKFNAGRDMFLNSQSAIPGTEEAVGEMMTNIEKILGAENVHYPKRTLNEEERIIHVSGHGKAGDMQEAMTIILGENKNGLVIPVHGDYEQMRATAKIAQDSGYKAVVQPNFQGIEFSKDENGKTVMKPVKEASQPDTWYAVKNSGPIFYMPDYSYDIVRTDPNLKPVVVQTNVPFKNVQETAKGNYQSKGGKGGKGGKPKGKGGNFNPKGGRGGR